MDTVNRFSTTLVWGCRTGFILVLDMSKDKEEDLKSQIAAIDAATATKHGFIENDCRLISEAILPAVMSAVDPHPCCWHGGATDPQLSLALVSMRIDSVPDSS